MKVAGMPFRKFTMPPAAGTVESKIILLFPCGSIGVRQRFRQNTGFFKSLSKSPKTNCEFSGCPILRKLSWVPLSNAHLLITGVWVSCGISGRERDKLKKRKDAGGAVVERADSKVLLPIPDGDTDEVKKPSVSDIGVQADINAKKPPSVSEVGVQADIGACHLCYKMEERYLNEIYMLRDWVARHYSWGLDVAKNVLYISKRR